MSKLFSPIALRGLRLRNRIVVSPMLMYRAEGGHTNDWHVMNLGQFAAAGVGLVMMESTKVDPDGCSTLRDAAIWDDAYVPGLRRIVDHVHSLGTPIGVQLGHSGRKAGMVLPWEGRGVLDLDRTPNPAGAPWQLVGPSAIPHSDACKTPHALSVAEIGGMIDTWVAAARRALAAGFDVIELHLAHGYLGHQFLSPHANRRGDGYGGSLQNRMRFALELAEAVRAVWPADRPLFARLSCVDGMGWTIEDSIALSRELAARGVDIVDCSTGGMAVRGENLRPGYGYQTPFAAAIRAQAGAATMAVGMIVDPRQAEAIIATGKADLVALGRELLHNPHWAYHAAQQLGVAEPESLLPPSYAYWLDKRGRQGLGDYPGVAADPVLS